ncbi:MAG TPA: hypothetical protein VM187_05380 [Niastella sp.]|nr:hypothetical protein [Niastella sp.]
MKKLVSALLLAVVCFGCGQADKKEPIKDAPKRSANATNKPPLFQYGNPVLLQYDRYIDGLDTQLVEMSSQAIDTFKLLFKNQPAEVCDTALFIFKQFHYRLSVYSYWHMGADSISYEQILFEKDENGKPYKLSQRQIARKKTLDRNGFLLASSEGEVFIDQDLEWISTQFGKYLSTPMRQYIAQVGKEQKDGFEADAGLTIEPKVLAERAIWWENFSKLIENTKFLYAKEAANQARYVLYTIMEGMDNTSVADYVSDSTGPSAIQLSEYFNTAWSYLKEKYPTAKTTQVITPNYEAYLKKDSAAISQVHEQFRKEYKSPWEE